MTGPSNRLDISQSAGDKPRSEDDLGSILEDVYGRVDWQAAGGVLQVTAIAADDRATIALGPDAPSSVFDRFVLGFARARVDALVTTGSILRAEPELVHRYAEDNAQNSEWQGWRTETLGRTAAPGLILLSRSGDFPSDHPAIEAAESGFVWTSKAGRARMGARVGELEVVVEEEVEQKEGEKEDFNFSIAKSAGARNGLAAALCFARTRRGLERIAIEAGPSATRALYLPDSFPARARVDEVLLSLYRGELLASARASEFASEEQLRATGLRRVSICEKQEASGVWAFERHRLSA